MKTGLLTFYHIHHYGAMLQAYATERAVASLGSECEIIDYYVNQDNTLFQRPTGLGSAAHDAHTALHYGPLKARYERFEAFSRENLNISGRRYQSLEELRQAELPYDVLLSGSDQIWNPKIDLKKYAGGKSLYGWIVGEAEAYDTPSPLAEFGLNRPPMSWQYVEIPDPEDE